MAVLAKPKLDCSQLMLFWFAIVLSKTNRPFFESYFVIVDGVTQRQSRDHASTKTAKEGPRVFALNWATCRQIK